MKPGRSLSVCLSPARICSSPKTLLMLVIAWLNWSRARSVFCAIRGSWSWLLPIAVLRLRAAMVDLGAGPADRAEGRLQCRLRGSTSTSSGLAADAAVDDLGAVLERLGPAADRSGGTNSTTESPSTEAVLIQQSSRIEHRARRRSISVMTRTPRRLEQLDVGHAANLHAAHRAPACPA